MCNLMPSEKELMYTLIDQFTSLQRIIHADDAKKEASYQLQFTKAKLESLGIHTTEFKID